MQGQPCTLFFLRNTLVRRENLLQGKLFDDITLIKPEYKYNKSRIDFYIETKTDKILLEVKGVTLEEDGIAMFPE